MGSHNSWSVLMVITMVMLVLRAGKGGDSLRLQQRWGRAVADRRQQQEGDELLVLMIDDGSEWGWKLEIEVAVDGDAKVVAALGKGGD